MMLIRLDMLQKHSFDPRPTSCTGKKGVAKPTGSIVGSNDRHISTSVCNVHAATGAIDFSHVAGHAAVQHALQSGGASRTHLHEMLLPYARYPAFCPTLNVAVVLVEVVALFAILKLMFEKVRPVQTSRCLWLLHCGPVLGAWLRQIPELSTHPTTTVAFA